MSGPTQNPVDCSHRTIDHWSDADGKVFLWACRDCRLRFYPACPVCVVDGHRSGVHTTIITGAGYVPESLP